MVHLSYNKLGKKNYCLIGLLLGVKLAIAQDVSGTYICIGSGVNMVSKSGLIKTYNNSQGEVASQNLGNVTGYSLPIFLYSGYRFNNYLSAEFTYTYSGNQNYQGPEVNGSTTFVGSQNTFGLSAVGYLPLTENFYLKGRIGAGYSLDTMTRYIGDPGTKNTTSILGLGLQYFLFPKFSIDMDYINYGLLAPMKLEYTPPPGGPNLGTVDSLMVNQLFVSLNFHF